MRESTAVLKDLRPYVKNAVRKPHGQYATVYVLTNYDTTMEENLYRIDTLRDMGHDPYVMVYDKPHAPIKIKHLQRRCNNRIIFKTVKDFYNYNLQSNEICTELKMRIGGNRP